MTEKKSTKQKVSVKCFLGILTICLGTSVQVAFVNSAYNVPHKLSDEALFGHHNISSFAVWVRKVGLDSVWSGIAALKSLGFLVAFLVAKCFAEYLGRKGSLIMAEMICLFGVSLQAGAQFQFGFWYFTTGFLIHSFGAGLMLPVCSFFITETVAKTKRATFSHLNPILISFLIPVIMAFGLPALSRPFINHSVDIWPFLFVIPLASIGITLTTLLFLPESPKYLCLKNSKNIQKIEKSLGFYFGSAFSSFYYIEDLLREELRESPAVRGFGAIKFAWQTGSYQIQYMYLVFVAGIMEIIGFSSVLSLLSVRALSTKSLGLEAQVVNYGIIVGFFLSFLALLLSRRLVEDYGKRTMFLLGSSVQIFSYLGLSVLGFCISYVTIMPPEFGYVTLFLLCLAAISHQIGYAGLPNTIIQDHLYYSAVGEPTKALGRAAGSFVEFLIVLGFMPLEKIGFGYPWITILTPLIAGYIYFACNLPGCPRITHIPTLEELLDQYGKLLWPADHPGQITDDKAPPGHCQKQSAPAMLPTPKKSNPQIARLMREDLKISSNFLRCKSVENIQEEMGEEESRRRRPKLKRSDSVDRPVHRSSSVERAKIHRSGSLESKADHKKKLERQKSKDEGGNVSESSRSAGMAFVKRADTMRKKVKKKLHRTSSRCIQEESRGSEVDTEDESESGSEKRTRKHGIVPPHLHGTKWMGHRLAPHFH